MKVRKVLSNVWMVLKYYMKYAPEFVIAQSLFTIFVSAVWTLQGPITIKFLFDALLNKKDIKEIITFLAIVTVFVILRHIFACYTVEYLESIAMIKVKEKILAEIHKKAATLDVEYYETPEFYTDYVWAAQQAPEKFNSVFGTYITTVARTSELLFMGGVMLVLNPVLIILALITGIVSFIEQKKRVNLHYEANIRTKPIERERDYASRVFYLADYAKEIRLSKVHELIYDKFVDANKRIEKEWIKTGKKAAVFRIYGILITETLSTLAMYGYLAYGVIESGSITIGDFSALTQSAGRFSNRLRQVIITLTRLSEESLYIDKYRNFLAYEPKIELQKGEKPSREIEPLILKNVSFTYNGESTPALNNVNMTIHPFEKVAIVGYNGAGKTTLIKLLMRLYDPTEGEIYLGNTNIKDFDTGEYRKLFAAVFQDYQIFAASLGENVVMDHVNENAIIGIERALVHSNFENKLNELKDGIHTSLTKEFDEEGTNLSGGEAQKVAIARAFYKDSSYAIMDEPSSALDPIAEYKLNENMVEIARDKTVIFISHRLTTTIMADKIYMFENGEIIEEGNHRELLNLGGKYAEMFRKQGSNYQG